MKRHINIAPLILGLFLAHPTWGQSFVGTLDSTGYHPPAGLMIRWSSGTQSVLKRLNPNASYSGPGGLGDLFPRYGENDPAILGWHPRPAVANESQGGEARAIVVQLFRAHNIGREPTDQEWVDFSFANFANFDNVPEEVFFQFFGFHDPGAANLIAGGSAGNPLRVDDPSRSFGTVWQLPAPDSRWVINIHGSAERPQITLPPPSTPPVEPPPPAKPPETPPPAPVPEPLKFCGSIATAGGTSRFELDGNPCGKALASDVPSVTWVGPCGERPVTCVAIPKPAAVKECPACPPAPACAPVPVPRACDPCPDPVICPKPTPCPPVPVLASLPRCVAKALAKDGKAWTRLDRACLKAALRGAVGVTREARP